MKILIMGLPGSGKTTLANKLKKKLNAGWINADQVREKNNDWDFSKDGVLRQSKRMGLLADKLKSEFVIADFICPFEKGRMLFKADYTIWMDTIKESNYEDTDRIFEAPSKTNLRVTKWNQYSPSEIADFIKNV